MTKDDLIKEFDRLIEAHYSKEIDSIDEWLREIIYLKYNVFKKLTIPVVVGQSELLAAYQNFIDWNEEHDRKASTSARIEAFIASNCE